MGERSMITSLRELDLGTIFASTKLSPDLPPEMFVRRATRRLPDSVVEPANPNEFDSEPQLPPIGSVLGKYRLERAIGIGGFGAVYRARHVMLDNVVAIKLMRPSVVHSRPALLRLLTVEAKFSARIDHANVVRVHDVAIDDANTYIVMEYVDGPDLSVMIRRKGALPYRMMIRVLRHVTAALAAGLAENLVHRDVKPSNILLTRDGVTKLADFGLARSSSAADISGLRGVVGTAAYMAPEQSSDSGRVDFRSDIYSLGVTAYQALTGRLPFPDSDPKRCAEAHRTQPVIPPGQFSKIPPALDALLVSMMAKSPQDRPRSYAALDSALRAMP